MERRLIALVIPLVLLAALPSAASASPVLTENGIVLPIGATVQATSIGVPLRTTSLGSNECKRSVMHGNVVANTGTQIEIELSSFSILECASPLGFENIEGSNLPWCWKTTKSADSFELRGGKCSEPAKALTLLRNKTCPYTRTAMTGTFKTSPEDVVMTVLEQEFVTESGFGCQTFKLDINYTMETAASPFTALTIS